MAYEDDAFRLAPICDSEKLKIESLVSAWFDNENVEGVLSRLAYVEHVAESKLKARMDKDAKRGDRKDIAAIALRANVLSDRFKAIYVAARGHLWELADMKPGKQEIKGGHNFQFKRRGIVRVAKFAELKRDYPDIYKRYVEEQRDLSAPGSLTFIRKNK